MTMQAEVFRFIAANPGALAREIVAGTGLTRRQVWVACRGLAARGHVYFDGYTHATRYYPLRASAPRDMRGKTGLSGTTQCGKWRGLEAIARARGYRKMPTPRPPAPATALEAAWGRGV